MRRIMLSVAFVLVVSTVHALEVYQDLDEATARIERLKDKPVEKLIDADGFYQSETLIFKDTGTGCEVWSLTMEECIDLANIERRMVFSADGSVFSMKSSRAYRDTNGNLQRTRWTGHNYLMNVDLTKRRKLWALLDGRLQQLTDKFDTWDPVLPRTLYFVTNDKLYRVSVGDVLGDNRAEVIYTFPNANRKFLQTINDDRILCIQDNNGTKSEDEPLFYVIDLKKKPDDPKFCRYRSFNYGGMTGIPGHDPKNEYRVHGIGVDRASDRVSWGYGSMTSPGEGIGFSVPLDDLDAKPTVRRKEVDPWEQYVSHPGLSIRGDRVGFSGPTAKTNAAGIPGGWGLWMRPEGKRPIFCGKKCGGGHCSWCGNDPDVWFAHVYVKKEAWQDDWICDKIVAGNLKGEVVRLCTPYDRRRGGGKAGYDGIPRPNQSPDATKCWFHSSMLMPRDTCTGSFIVVFRRPYAPTALRLAGGKVRITPHAVTQEVKSYLIYRRDGRTWTTVKAVPAKETEVDLPEAGTYMMTALEWSGLESDESSPTITLPGGRTGKAVKDFDKAAPAAPTGFTATREAPGQNRLKWTAPVDADVRYFNLYFSETGRPGAEQKRRFASPPAGTTEYLDWTAPKDAGGQYAVTAVDRQGNESTPAFAPAGE
ncbi:MAG TPA: hypothetical protein VMY39_03835 [Planctomycetota bacterium]|nr:hypothetical protein [Planctomycetota bacterium]